MITYGITQAAISLGVRLAVGVISNVEVRPTDTDLERWKRGMEAGLRRRDTADEGPALEEYRRILALAGQLGMEPSVDFLLSLIRRSGRLPSINTVVDAYNVHSADQLVVVSVHDQGRLRGSLRMVRLGRDTPFSPLGSGDSLIIKGGFGIRDDFHMLCMNNCKQSRYCAVGVETTDLVIAVQGHPSLEGEKLVEQLDKICETIMRFNGGVRESVAEGLPPDPDLPMIAA